MQKLHQQELSPAEREERLQYLKGLFRLSFRTSMSVGDTLKTSAKENDGYSDEEEYDDLVDFEPDAPSDCGDEGEIEEFRADFKAIAAEDVFIQLCLDYYQDVLAGFQNQQKLKQWDITTTSICADIARVQKKRLRTPGKKGKVSQISQRIVSQCTSYYKGRLVEINDRVALTEKYIRLTQQKIAALEQELAQIKAVKAEPKKLSKNTLATENTLLPTELTK